MMFVAFPFVLFCELRHDVRLSVHGELLAVHLDLISAKLREQDLVPDGDTHRHGLTILGLSAGASGAGSYKWLWPFIYLLHFSNQFETLHSFAKIFIIL